ncbi:MAG: peptide chain release factor 1 [Candidatus Marinimicrobia bacterium]|nr:peptide chain release factor 1 [Candidatus Neomarinimicrobiota bacterium]|tara:strand:- start:8604 stop:9671 length:1068 start_codon:yes stop_codon:yes gene_type:complete
MRDKLESIIGRYLDLEKQMADQDVLSSPDKLKELAKEYKQLDPVVITGKEYIKTLDQIIDCEEIVESDDAELKELAIDELDLHKKRKTELEKELKIKLLPKDPLDNKNIILEIRAGTGGDEAALFAADLFRLYSHFSEKYNWEKKLIASNEIGIGGFKEVIIALKGRGAYGMLKYESGVHRVQRVPETETGGRVHTSAATVAVLPEAEEVDVEITDTDLKIDTYRASGAGGQHVNKTESAIRITHIPTGLVVTCQDESSQHKNRAAALKVLRSRLLADQKEKAAAERAAERKSLVSTGDRSAKIRTYNFPQGRVTDHRINFTSYRFSEIMNGDIEEIIEKLKIAEQQDILSAEVT